VAVAEVSTAESTAVDVWVLGQATEKSADDIDTDVGADDLGDFVETNCVEEGIHLFCTDLAGTA